MNILTPAFLCSPFAWVIFFHPFTFSLYVSLDLKWVSYRQHIYGSCFCIHSVSLGLLIGRFTPFTFKVIINMYVLQFSSVAQSCPTLCNPMNRSTPGLPVHHQLQEFTHIHTIESVMPSSHLILCCPFLPLRPIPPRIRVFPMSQLFAWGGQSTGVSVSISSPPEKSQGWSPSEWTGWMSLHSKELSRFFSNTTVQKHKLFGAQLSSQSDSHIHAWPLEKP